MGAIAPFLMTPRAYLKTPPTPPLWLIVHYWLLISFYKNHYIRSNIDTLIIIHKMFLMQSEYRTNIHFFKFKDTRLRAASGGPRSPFGFEEAFKGGRGIQGGKCFKFFFHFSKFETLIFLYSSLSHGESIDTLGSKIGSEIWPEQRRTRKDIYYAL